MPETQLQLTSAQVEELQTTLHKARQALSEQLAGNKQASDVVTLDQSMVGRVSRMDALQQQSMALSTRTKTEARLRRIIAALQSIDDGDYGYCRRCDEAIGFGRLKAQPETPLCIQCQSHMDNSQ